MEFKQRQEANNAINNLGKWMQNTTPVKMFDQKFEQLKGKVAGKFPKLAKSLASMGDWAKENPGKTAAIIGILTTMASLAGGPVGGAIAGQILKGSAEFRAQINVTQGVENITGIIEKFYEQQLL
jgi:hypothetical protein